MLQRWMALLELTDVQVAHAFNAGWGLQESTTDRVGEWRRGSSMPQSLARAQRLEVALQRLASERQLDLPDGALVIAWQEQRAARREAREVRPVHSSSRSALQTGENGDHVRLTGFVSRHHPTGRTLFFDISDGQSPYPLQFGIIRDDVEETTWTACKALRIGDRIRATGILQPNRRGVLVAWVTEPPSAQEPVTDKSLATAAPEQRRVAASLLTAALRDLTEDHLRRQGFLGVATRVLSSSWPDGSGLRPLTAVYPGFGTSAFVAPSPSPQLVDALIFSGTDRVYTSSHCFTTSFRDDLDGVETDLVMAKATDLDVNEIRELIQDIITLVGRHLGLHELIHETLRHTLTLWPSLQPDETGFPQLVEAVSEDALDSPQYAFRAYTSKPSAPIEATLEVIGSGVAISTIAIFPARFLPLAESTPIRRIYPLGGPIR